MTASLLYLFLITHYHIPATDAATLTCIAIAESNLDNTVVHRNRNGTLDYGLFQINSVHIGTLISSPTELLDIDGNIKVAIELYRRDGFTIWSTYDKC